MKKLFLITLIITIVNILSAQTEEFSKKNWKKFNEILLENISAAEKFYKGNIDLNKRDEENGMPTSKIPLPNATRNFIETAGYSSINLYSFNTEKEAEEFFKQLKDKLTLPATYQMIPEDSFIGVSAKNEAGLKTTVEIELSNTQITVFISPPLDVPIPNY